MNNLNLTKKDLKPFFGQRFMLTIHGQLLEDLTNLIKFFDHTEDFIAGVKVTTAVIAKEFGKFKIHPHWQIYLEFDKQISLKTLLHSVLGHSNTHIEKARGTRAACINYIYAVDKYWEAGFVVYNKNAEVPYNYDGSAVEFWNNFQPRPFQQQILDLLQESPDRRSINFIYETRGNVGKTIIAEYLHIYRGAIITGGASADMKFAVARWQEITGHYPVIIIVDACRTDKLSEDSYKALEAIKNGFFFNGKYESAMAHSYFKPHVLIFANKPPEKKYFSEDRWKIFRIEDFSLIQD